MRVLNQLESMPGEVAIEQTSYAPEQPTDIAPPRARKRRTREQVAADRAATEHLQDARTLADISKESAARTTGWAKSDVDALQLLLGEGLILLSIYVSHAAVKDRRLALQDMEASAFAGPLSNIITRHFQLKAAKKGDLADILAIAAASLAYGIRVFNEYDEKRSDEIAKLNRMAIHEQPSIKDLESGIGVPSYTPVKPLEGDRAA